METMILDTAYFISAILFILGIKQLGHPSTSSRGNRLAALGMGIAIITTFFLPIEDDYGNYLWIFGAIIIGSLIGIQSASRVAMTAMPEMVSIFNGLGGAAAMLISYVELRTIIKDGYNYQEANISQVIVLLLTMKVATFSFSGSMVAFGKLSEKIKNIHIPLNKILSFLALFFMIGVLISIGNGIEELGSNVLLICLGVAFVYGILLVAPVGGADMPVVISLLNALTGVTSLLAGFIFDSYIMILGGVLVGSSGVFLTILMGKAMNRSLWQVLMGNFGGKNAVVEGEKFFKSTTVDDTSILLNYSGSVVFVPGYGMAVAQAQKLCKEIEDILEENGVEVRYAIHPVAGRMPGHMNILLAEVNVDYDKLLNLDEANEYLETADLAVVVGANDVVNPMAIEEEGSSIYGMPIIDLRPVKQIIVLKRSMAVGYAGIDNTLFYRDNTKMLFGDAKQRMQELVNELKNINQ